MAELTEAARSPAALMWRSRVVELDPHSADDRLALVQSAMMFRDYASATNALEAVDAAGKKTAAFHNLAGALALTANRPDEAEAHFLEASRLEPTNAIPQLNLAVLRLRSTNASVASDGRASLTRISANPALRCQALRELVLDAVNSRQTNIALSLCSELVQQSNSAFSDRLLQLDVLKGTRNADFKQVLAACQKEAGNEHRQDLRTEQLGNGAGLAQEEADDTLTWPCKHCREASRPPNRWPCYRADCRARVEADWSGLNGTLTNQELGRTGSSIRHARFWRALCADRS